MGIRSLEGGNGNSHVLEVERLQTLWLGQRSPNAKRRKKQHTVAGRLDDVVVAVGDQLRESLFAAPRCLGMSVGGGV